MGTWVTPTNTTQETLMGTWVTPTVTARVT